MNSSYIAADYPPFPYELAVARICLPEDVHELITRFRLALDRGASYAAEVNDLRLQLAICERTVALLSVSDE
jgi:hypothetical protein